MHIGDGQGKGDEMMIDDEDDDDDDEEEGGGVPILGVEKVSSERWSAQLPTRGA